MNKFTEDYKPEETDIKVKLLFHKKGTKELDVSLGNYCPDLGFAIILVINDKFQDLNIF